MKHFNRTALTALMLALSTGVMLAGCVDSDSNSNTSRSTEAQSNQQSTTTESDPFWADLKRLNKHSPDRLKMDLQRDRFWYYENPLEYNSRTLSTEGEFISRYEASNFDEAKPEDYRSSWQEATSGLTSGGRSVISLLRRVNDTMLGCGQDYFATVRGIAEADLLPLELTEQDINTTQKFFEQYGYYSIASSIWGYGTGCRNLYPDTRPTRQQATDFARFVVLSVNTHSLSPPLLEHVSPQLQAKFKRDQREKDFAGSAQRADWIAGWLKDHGLKVNEDFFTKVKQFISEHPDASPRGD